MLKINQKLHWYCFTFIGPEGYSSTYTGYKDNKITYERINENKVYSDAGMDAVLLSASYLGHMTGKEFRGEGQHE